MILKREFSSCVEKADAVIGAYPHLVLFVVDIVYLGDIVAFCITLVYGLIAVELILDHVAVVRAYVERVVLGEVAA